MPNCTNSSERCELARTPANFPALTADLPGCVHNVTATKLAAIKNTFSFGQWAYKCEQANRYAGNMVEVNDSQSRMTMTPL